MAGIRSNLSYEGQELCRCTLPRLTRLNREGLVDRIFAIFGRYPWKCRSCGQRSYRSQRGRKNSPETPVLEAQRNA